MVLILSKNNISSNKSEEFYSFLKCFKNYSKEIQFKSYRNIINRIPLLLGEDNIFSLNDYLVESKNEKSISLNRAGLKKILNREKYIRKRKIQNIFPDFIYDFQKIKIKTKQNDIYFFPKEGLVEIIDEDFNPATSKIMKKLERLGYKKRAKFSAPYKL
jgi:hypothetical protein